MLRIQSFSKSHGPDLRIAAVGARQDRIDQLVKRRQLGPGWTPRLLQQILLAMLTDPEIEAGVERAANIYQSRREHLSSLLASSGVALVPGSGLNLWVPVAQEQIAVVALAAQGIGVAPGSPFRSHQLTGDAGAIRVSLGNLGQERDVELAAEAIAAASLGVHANGGARNHR